MDRWEWLRLIARLELGSEVKNAAVFIAVFANSDGSCAMPGDARVLDAVNLSDRQMREHTDVLKGLKLLHVTSRGGGRGGAGQLTVCQLSEPADGALPYRMDGDYLRIEERPKGRAPEKAIAASKAARNRRKAASGQNSTPPSPVEADDRNSASGETADIDRYATSGQSEDATAIDRNSPSGQSENVAPIGRNSASGQSATAAPVDNSIDRNAASGQTGHAVTPNEYPASGHSEIDRKPATHWPEAPYRLTGSQASDSPKHKNLTPLDLPSGGDLTSGAGPEPTPTNPPLPQPEADDERQPLDEGAVDEFDPAAVAAPVPLMPDPDIEYDRARETLAALFALDPVQFNECLNDAQSELEAEAAAAWATHDDGVKVHADSRQITIRAAQIVLRAAPPEADR